MLNSITRIGTTRRWSDVVVYKGVARLCEVPTTLPAPFEAQAREILAQVEATLGRAGSSKEQILLATIYLTDMADRAAFNDLWDAWVPPGTAPVRACVAVAALADPHYKIEMVVEAAV